MNGLACDDGDGCTTGDTCGDGACSGAPLDCSDGDACTADTCADGACLHDDACFNIAGTVTYYRKADGTEPGTAAVGGAQLEASVPRAARRHPATAPGTTPSPTSLPVT